MVKGRGHSRLEQTQQKCLRKMIIYLLYLRLSTTLSHLLLHAVAVGEELTLMYQGWDHIAMVFSHTL